MMQVQRKSWKVNIKLNEPVKEFLFEGKTVSGAQTENGIYRADKYVMNVDFATGMKGLIPDKLRKKWSDKKIDKEIFMFYIYAISRH